MVILDFKVEQFDIQVFGSIKHIDSTIWDTIQVNLPFYQSHAFLSEMEDLQHEIDFRYILIGREGSFVGALYIQALPFSFKNLVNYSGEGSGMLRTMFRKLFASTQIKLLNLGNVCFTGDKGIISDNEDVILPLIPIVFSKVRFTFEDRKPSASLIANVYSKDDESCGSFLSNGFHSFDTEPDIFMQLNASWLSFEDYLQSLSSKYRIRTKKVKSISNTLVKMNLSLDEILQQSSILLDLYKNVVEKASFNMSSLNVDFFPRMKSMYGDRTTLMAYYKNNKMVGYAFLFHLDAELLHVHYIGLDYSANTEHKLYNRMLLDFVEFAIQNKIKRIHFGRTATEIKTTIGAVPTPLRAYLRMDNKLINLLLPYIFRFIKPAPYVARSPFK